MKSSFSIIIVFLALALAGLCLLPGLPVKLFPSRDLPTITVSFNMPNNSSRVIEQEVTSRLEGALARLSGIKNINSETGNGYGKITIELDRHADIDVSRLQASATIRQLWNSLPPGVLYPSVSTRQVGKDGAGPFMTYSITAPIASADIAQYAETYIKPRLSDIQGIDKIDIRGAYPMEWRLEYDASTLSTLGISVDQISDAIKNHYKSEFLGIVPNDDGWIRVVKQPQAKSSNFDISQIQITSDKGEIISLDRILKSRHVEEVPSGYFRINGLNSIYLNISAEAGANQLDLSNRVEKTIADLQLKAPYGMQFILSNNTTDKIRDELSKIYFRSGLTILILLIFIILITQNLRYSLLVMISLAINLALAVIFYRLFNTEIQLYSLAGITISLNLIIDNIIVMCDHYIRRHDLKAFPAILAATLTTVGALMVVFLLDEEVRLNLQDFVIVVAVNLCISLLVALFLVPALAQRMNVKTKTSLKSRRRKKFNAAIDNCYRIFIHFSLRFKWAFFIIIVGTIAWTGYLFFDKVKEGQYFNRNDEEIQLGISATLPSGSTLEQMNHLIKKMENFLTEYPGIRQFQTDVMSGQRAHISVDFNPDVEKTSLPLQLKSQVINKVLTLGGGSWNVYGIDDSGFSNDVRESAGNYRIKMLGADYDELYEQAEKLRKMLLNHRRIKEVLIRSEFSWWNDDYTEFCLNPNRNALAQHGISITDFYSAISPIFTKGEFCTSIPAGNNTENVTLSSIQSSQYDVWALLNTPIVVGDKLFKVSDLASIDKEQASQKINKENQSYRLCLQYDYIGSPEMAKKLMKQDLQKFKTILPTGYTADEESYHSNWDDSDFSRYWLLALIVLIIFFISAILFNSLRKPLAIIAIIPMSFVGIFLTFYLFNLKFDQGGFASFILLSGITVNSAIYIINELEILKRKKNSKNNISLYLKSFRVKIIPILMTILSTVLGFIPFLIGTSKESFWFPLAAGTIGGLLFSLFAIIVYLPLLLLTYKRKKKQPNKTSVL